MNSAVSIACMECTIMCAFPQHIILLAKTQNNTCQTNSVPPHEALVPHFHLQIDQEETRSQLATLGKAICHPVPNWTAVFSQDYLSHIQMFLDLNIHKNSL